MQRSKEIKQPNIFCLKLNHAPPEVDRVYKSVTQELNFYSSKM